MRKGRIGNTHHKSKKKFVFGLFSSDQTAPSTNKRMAAWAENRRVFS